VYRKRLLGLADEVGLARPESVPGKSLGQEFQQLLTRAKQDLPTLLDPYGASNRAEFFAVASECFFRRPIEMQQATTDQAAADSASCRIVSASNASPPKTISQSSQFPSHNLIRRRHAVA
jgi:hypothetical protein